MSSSKLSMTIWAGAALGASLAFLQVGCGDSDVPSPPAEPASCADADADGMCDASDNCPSAHNTDQDDFDGDGVGNACDPADDTNCLESGGDDDEDDVCQASDNCPGAANPDQADGDADGEGDACDEDVTACGGTSEDLDGDGVCNQVDNCVVEPNAEQQDGDADGLGDACDPVQGPDVCAGNGGDADDDDVCQAWDNCPESANRDQSDLDDDGTGDVCDPTPAPCDDLGGDADGDTVCTALDNCPDDSNINQLDVDNDNVGDVCDPFVPVDPSDPPCAGLGGDADNDDYCSFYDNCPTITNPTQSDVDDDGMGDACDAETCDGVDNDGDGAADEGFADTDADGTANCVDPCPTVPNTDLDADGFIDCQDPCPADPLNDADDDDICGDTDNCPNTPSSNQNDDDGDGIGNVCDIEECDGVNNDGDFQVDEGMPDADDDGDCDDIDPCPADPANDSDGDGLCADADNCPITSNVGQADGDGDGWGDACDIDSPLACSAAAALNAPGTVPLPTGLGFGDIVADPASDRVYVSVRANSTSHPNEVLAVNVGAGPASIAWALPVGSDPIALAISADGSILYVALQNAAAVRMVNVGTRRACLTFPVGPSSFGPMRAGDIEVLPSASQSVVISARRPGVSPDFGGVRVYDQGVVRPLATPDHTGARMITIASDTVVYGYNNSSTEFGFRMLSITPAGIAEVWEQEMFSGFNLDILFHAGRVYTTSGVVLDPGPPVLVGQFSGASGPVAVDAAFTEAYYANSSSLVRVFNTTTLNFERDVNMTGATGTPLRVVRWGANGLALLTASGLSVAPAAAGQ